MGSKTEEREGLSTTVSMRLPASKGHRKRVLLAAVDLFVKHGFHQTGLDDIARRAGVSLETLTSYFPDKDAILREVARKRQKAIIDQAIGGLEAAPVGRPDKKTLGPEHREMLRAMMCALLEFRRDDARLADLIRARRIDDPELDSLWRAAQEVMINRLARLLHRWGTEADAHAASVLICGIIEGALAMHIDLAVVSDERFLESLTDALIRIGLGRRKK